MVCRKFKVGERKLTYISNENKLMYTSNVFQADKQKLSV